ncbi:MAG: hypothetical protein UDK36_02660 [Bacteroidaceae bacterium]|nr:hypothetical protein [Bacteroidaceae bacterium]
MSNREWGEWVEEENEEKSVSPLNSPDEPAQHPEWACSQPLGSKLPAPCGQAHEECWACRLYGGSLQDADGAAR